MERALGGEVKKARELRPDDSGHRIEGKIPGYTKEYGLEEFRKQRAPEQEISGPDRKRFPASSSGLRRMG